MTRYSPSKNYWKAGGVALALAAVCGAFAFRWTPSLIACVLFVGSAVLLFLLARRPAIEIHPHHLRIGERVIQWTDIKRVDRTGWLSPLVVILTLSDQSRIPLIYPGDLGCSNSLLQHLRRAAHHALIDGVPYRDYWREPAQSNKLPEALRKQLPSPKYPLLLEEDEAEVERLYQRLKTVGHLDQKDEN
jgi:hypothetical protein